MCGIAGVLYADPGRRPAAETLKAMGNAIAHRGPDAEGFFAAAGVGLAHRRLSIIDLAGGDQPIGNEDGGIQVVLNGEVYNYRELRADLERRGHRFRTNSDTEVLVHLYEDLGWEMVRRLRGMFAFAVWDGPNRRLLLGRDRTGIKPLYVYRDTEKLVFGSELKAVLAHPGVARRMDVAALEDYLAFGMVTGRHSIFRNVERLPPAHVWQVQPGSWRGEPQCYWRLEFDGTERRPAGEWVDRIRAKVEDAVRVHMVADVPVGAFLSGGVDSAVVVACARDAAPTSLNTYSLGFREESRSELPAAGETAAHLGTRHVTDVVTADAADLLDTLCHHFDEPFADTSAVPTFLVSKLARRGVKVALSGDGGDEAFGGYARYGHDLREDAVRRRLPAWFRRGLGVLAPWWPKSDWLPRPLRAKTALANLALAPAAAYANTLQTCRNPDRRRLFARHVAAGLNGYRPESAVETAFAAAPTHDALAGMIAADVATLLPDDYLVKVDRASMAHGLEVRPPLLDHELLELCARMPSEFKVRGGETKWAFKQAFQDRLPAGTTRRPKQGFEVPIDNWMRGPLAERFIETVLARDARIAQWIDTAKAESMFRAHRTGLHRHGQVLWSVLVLAAWCDRYQPD
jgi:asparagine synthase (glutamine-hydrolysing)